MNKLRLKKNRAVGGNPKDVGAAGGVQLVTNPSKSVKSAPLPLPDPEDDRPIERDARKPPKAPKVKPEQVKPRIRSLDPRFDQIHGDVNPKHVTERYAFIKEIAAKENEERQDRLKKLRAAKRRLQNFEGDGEEDAEEDAAIEKKRKVGAKSRKNIDWDYSGGMGDADEDDDDDGAELDSVDQVLNEFEDPDDIDAELRELQRETSKFKQTVQMDKAQERVRKVKADHMKKELEAVKENQKAKPFFMKKKDLKKEVERTRYEELEKKGGKQMVGKFAEKKMKRKQKYMPT